MCGLRLAFFKLGRPPGGVYIPPLIMRFRSWLSPSVVRSYGSRDFLSPSPLLPFSLFALCLGLGYSPFAFCRQNAMLARIMPVKKRADLSAIGIIYRHAAAIKQGGLRWYKNIYKHIPLFERRIKRRFLRSIKGYLFLSA